MGGGEYEWEKVGGEGAGEGGVTKEAQEVKWDYEKKEGIEDPQNDQRR